MKYYYLENNEKRGPFTIVELKKANLSSQTLIWFKGLDKWTMAKNIPEIDILLSSTIPSKQYYILDNNEKIGPFSIDELKDKDIKPTTLLWSKDLDEWTKAREIEELEEVIMPPIPVENAEKNLKQNAQTSNEPTTDKKNQKKVKEDNLSSPKFTNPKFVHNSSSYFQRPFSYKGRIGRMEYFVVIILYSFVYGLVEYIREQTYDEFAIIILLLVLLASFYFLVVNTAKRCHDVGNSGWYQLIPFYALYLLFASGEEKDNQWGNKP